MGQIVTGNTGRLLQSYVDDFSIGHAAGIVGEIGFQNPIDAARGGDVTNVRVNVWYHHEKRILKIRDRGTKGLDHCSECCWGLVEDDNTGEETQCQNYKDCNWSVFFSLAQEGKKAGDLGSRGQGKSLPAMAGENGLIVRTKIATEGAEHKSMAAYFRPMKGVAGAWEWGLLPEEAWGSEEDVGTEIEVSRVKKKVADDLKTPQKIVNEYVLPYWFPSIIKGMEITFNFTGHKKITVDKKMIEGLFPKVGDEKKKRTIDSVGLKSRGKSVGKLKDFHLFLAEDKLPEYLRGIALIKSNRQVITRVNNFGMIDRSLQNRIFGWVDTGRVLDSAELPNHLGYRENESIVKKAYVQIRNCAKDFLEPFNKELTSGNVTKKDEKRAMDLKEAVNSALEQNPEFNPWLEGEEPGPDPDSKNLGDENKNERGASREKNAPWISSIKFDPSIRNLSGGYEVGDDITGRITISNPVDAEPPNLSLAWAACNLSFEKVERAGIGVQEFGIIPRPISKEEPGKIVHEFAFNIHTGEGAFRRGKNWFEVQLAKQSLDGELEMIDKLRTSFWIGEKPPPKQKGSSGSDFLKDIMPMTQESDPPGKDVWLVMSDQTVYVFKKFGPTIAPFWGNGNQHQVAVRNLFQAIGDEIMKEIVTRKIADLNGDLNAANITGENGVIEEVLKLKRAFIADSESAYYS
jgi:hypothetical protein